MSQTQPSEADLERLSARAAEALRAAKAAGADAADAVALAQRTRSVSVRNGVIEEVESAEGNDLGLRAFCGERSAVVSVGPGADLAAAAERAVAMARAAPADATVRLARPGEYAEALDPHALDLADAAQVSADALIERAHALESAMNEVPGVTNSGGAGASASEVFAVLATTEGFEAGYRATRHGHGVTAVAGEGTAMERDSWYASARHLADLEDTHGIGRTAAERAVRRLDAQQLTTRTAPIVFEHRAASGFVGHILSAINGTAVSREASILAGKVGERICPAGITIVCDPTVRRGRASRPFDGEGLPAAPLTLVEDGVLAAYLLDLATAERLGLSSNARAARGTGTPSPSPTNVSVAGGSGDLAALIADLGSGLLVTDLIGRGANIVSGNYSRGAAGFWFENGEIVHPVSEITIAGDLSEMFARARFGDDAPGRYAVDAPAIAIEGMTIGGR